MTDAENMTEAGIAQHFKLNNSRRIPSIGLGTFQSSAGNQNVRDIVLQALKEGYRHIDTAADYSNEVEVGEAIRESGVSRNEIFVTTKL